MIEQALIKTLGFGSQEFVERAVKGGYDYRAEIPPFQDALCEVLLSPAAWKAVGVSLGNKDEMRCGFSTCSYELCEYAGYWPWNRKMVSFMETLALAEEESSKA